VALKKKLYPLIGKVQHYTWGGYHFIPALLDITNEEKKPYAEYWMGIHPLASAEIDSEHQFLNKLIDENKELVLGNYVAEHFGNLPYLFKILDVRDMLSIQVHPPKNQAQESFKKENAAGIALNASHRNYKDDNHKPELVAALGDFWLLHGFKAKNKMIAILNSVAELQSLLPVFENESYKGLYQFVMEMPLQKVNELLQPLLDRIVRLYKENKLSKDQEDFWAARAALTFNKDNTIDRGIFSVYLFNLVHLKKGEALFQDAGLPHAYLEGQNAEIMTNSDNVLRGGLTHKHIDVAELLKHVNCEATVPDILSGKINNRHETVFKTPVPEFQLSYISLYKGENFLFTSSTGEVLILVEGTAKFIAGEEKIKLNSGEAVFIVAEQDVEIQSTGKTLIYRASVPVPEG
jgi:mannose-6-phosphate isomerase